jgi:hypothetical protein
MPRPIRSSTSARVMPFSISAKACSEKRSLVVGALRGRLDARRAGERAAEDGEQTACGHGAASRTPAG